MTTRERARDPLLLEARLGEPPLEPRIPAQEALGGDPAALELAARAFGQKGTVAHGMWTKARCIAALEGSLPGAFAVEVRFTTPLRVPGRAAFGSRGSEFRPGSLEACEGAFRPLRSSSARDVDVRPL